MCLGRERKGRTEGATEEEEVAWVAEKGNAVSSACVVVTMEMGAHAASMRAFVSASRSEFIRSEFKRSEFKRSECVPEWVWREGVCEEEEREEGEEWEEGEEGTHM